MMTWEQTDKLHEIAQDHTKSADRRISNIRDLMREWAALANSRSMLPTNHATYEIPRIDPYMACVTKSARPDFPDFGVEGPKWYQNTTYTDNLRMQ